MTGIGEILKLDHDDVVWIANQMESKPSLNFIQLGIYFLVPTYTNCIVTCSVAWLIWD